MFARRYGFSHIYSDVGIDRIFTSIVFTFIAQFSQMGDNGLFESGSIGITTNSDLFHIFASKVIVAKNNTLQLVGLRSGNNGFAGLLVDPFR